MKQIILSFLVILFFVTARSQNKPSIQKSWIKTKVENLSNGPIEPDTLYTRYTFTKSDLKFSFNPAWDDYKQTWALNGNALTIGFDNYRIEELTDTSLVYALDGFRRFRFLAEEYLSESDKFLDSIGEYKGKALYKANKIITPRYKKESLRNEIGKSLEGYSIKKGVYFSATYVITEEGRVENVQIVNGITDGFNNAFIKQLVKTSKDWRPAAYKGKPIQTQMLYEIKYLNSIIPYQSGQLN